MEHISVEEATYNPVLDEAVEPVSDLKSILVGHVGEKLKPEDDSVTVGMIINVMADEFPEFIMALAEENWIRGYHQALEDVESGRAAYEEAMASDKQEQD